MVLGNSIGGEYFWVSITLSLMTIALILFISITRKYSYKYIKKKAALNKRKITKLEIPIGIILVILATQIITNRVLQDHADINETISNLVSTLLIIAITYLLIVIAGMVVDHWGNRLNKQRKDDTHEEIVPLAKSVTSIILIITAIFFLLQLWNVQVGGLLASLGIAGVILGFAFQDTLKNMFGGLALISDDSFRKGDLIELPDGELGYIMEINLRSTKIKNFNSQQVVIPNSQLSTMKIRNYALPTRITRIRIDISINKNADLYKAERVILDLVKNKKEILRYPRPIVLYDKISPYSADLFVSVHIKDYNNLFTIKSELIKEIQRELKRKGVKLAYPVTEVSFKNKEPVKPTH